MEHLAIRTTLPLEVTWYFAGWDRHSEPQTLALCFVARHSKKSSTGVRLTGLGIDYSRSFIEPWFHLSYLERSDVAINKGLIWLPEGNGVLVSVRNQARFHLMTIHAPLLPDSLCFVSFSKLPVEYSQSTDHSTFAYQTDTSW